jgi:predicted MFS family arabinose efflux permease
MALGIKRVSIFTVTFSAMVIWIGFYSWQVMFNNFAVQLLGATAADVGLIQAVREIPGLLAFGAGALALRLTESKIAALSVMTLGLGLLLCGASPTILFLTLATVVMSFGFHYFEPNNTSQLLALAEAGKLGRSQGRLYSYESLAGLIGAGLVLSLTLFLDFRATYYVIGTAILAIGLYLIVALPPNRGRAEQRKIKLKREYWLYYTLSFLRGCRRHIFTTFALFLLVKNHGLDITVISSIMLANSSITIFTNRLIGRLSDRLGERAVLVSCSFLLVFIFCGYAYISFLPVLIVFYLIDNVLFGSSIALNSYLRNISTPEDLTGCLSFGMTANHITAVIVPVLGGLAWSIFGHQVTFVAGAAIVFVDMLFAFKIPGRLS